MSVGADVSVSSAAGWKSLEAAAERRDPSAVGRVAREFEALLMGELWKSAAKPLGFSNLLDGGQAGRMYRERFFQEAARAAVESRPSAVAIAIQRRLEASQDAGTGHDAGRNENRRVRTAAEGDTQ